ncbi:sporulation integral membrane protein YtvI [Bacillus sp. CGMCC 1.16541]|uniref:sporulation integral membrane protein YtvI n=1 Tax=Bacillus sp. CGMCC 1.16541 TaxID=2185143 RepID=UPI000D731CCE|nr:sporulation integral membrane protein YtvI [Bacillus sp. CGMCC 1.16541]
MNMHYLYSTIRFILVLVAIVVGSFIVYYASTLTYPFIIALCLAFFINPIVNLFEKKLSVPRSLAVFISLILVFGFLIGLVILLITEIVSGTEHLATVVPTNLEAVIVYIENFIAAQIIPLYNQIASLFNSLNSGQQETILTNIQSAGAQITETVGEFLKNFLQAIPNVIAWLPNIATVIIFSLLATFFISKDWDRLARLGRKLLPSKARQSGKTVFVDLKKALFGFVKAQLTLISITTVIVLIGLLILQVEYAITIALLIGLVDILPYLGTGLIFVPWIIYAFASGNISFAIGLSVLYAIVIVQRQMMEPKILSSSIGLDPLATLISLFIGFKLIGFLGLIVGPVALVILRTLYTAGVFQDIWHFIIAKKPTS